MVHEAVILIDDEHAGVIEVEGQSRLGRHVRHAERLSELNVGIRRSRERDRASLPRVSASQYRVGRIVTE